MFPIIENTIYLEKDTFLHICENATNNITIY